MRGKILQQIYKMKWGKPSKIGYPNIRISKNIRTIVGARKVASFSKTVISEIGHGSEKGSATFPASTTISL